MTIGLMTFLICFGLIFILRLPISLGMITATLFYLLAAGLDVSMAADQILSNLMSQYLLIAVPLFVFTAKIMNSGVVTEKIFDFASALIGKRRGGMGHVNVLASIIFSGMTGSAVADASGLGAMEIKAMRKAGYDDGFSCAITAASSTIGPIFPPSIPMILYAMLSGASIGQLFIGGMIPGILLGIAMMIYISYISKKRNYPLGKSYTLQQFLQMTWSALPALFTVVVLLGGIYSGIVTPTEAAALAAFYALLISFFVYRCLSLKALWLIVQDTVKTTGILMSIVAAAYAFSYVVAMENIPALVGEHLLTITDNPFLLLLLINLVFLVLGMFLDTTVILLVFIPMVLPVVDGMGIDLVHFGVMVVMNMMIGLSTPPFGMLLFVVSGISKTKLNVIIKEIFPMFIAMLIVLFMVTYIPQLTLFLPSLLG
ncbi:TRAP transporter large permease [Vibrio sp. SS-MA-C1-2]|uniref:TRAP transporter large permease n=1 Tax=Vibrio sp. SS-MA-C1-2 TaxID=2908646 RepID=UPI001F18BA97|nr:TRAP transporter large permease [Vibrio sp. SS-MA-C1-2]UJF17812.1 TRAP transporter large permease [Vibrio sp. SS-MA-C1-2]